MRDKLSFNVKEFVMWYFYGAYVGTMTYYISYFTYLNSMEADGKNFGLWQFSFAAYVSVCLINVVTIGLYIQSWHIGAIGFHLLHLVCFYPGWVFIYNMWPDSYVYQNQLDFYSYTLFYLVTFLIACIALLPIAFGKQFRAVFLKPRLIDLVMSKRADKMIDIEGMLKIDIVKLDKDLDSDSDESVHMDDKIKESVNAASLVRVQNPTTAEHFKSESSSSARSEDPSNEASGRSEPSEESKGDLSRKLDSNSSFAKIEDEILSSMSNQQYPSEGNFHLKKNSSEAGSFSRSSMGNEMGKSKSDKKQKLISSLKQSQKQNSPAFDRFSNNVREFKTGNSRTSKKTRYENRRSNRSVEPPKFHPRSLKEETIDEKYDEEDNEVSINDSQHNIEEEKDDRSDESSEENEENNDPEIFTRNAESKVETSNDGSFSIIDQPKIKNRLT